MLYTWYRIARILLAGRFAPPARLTDEFILRAHVRLLDCDGLRVMTASQYFFYMDLARWISIARTGLFRAILRNGWAPAMGSQKIIYRKPLRRGTRFLVRLSVAGWDDKWVYHLHTFEREGHIYAVGVTKAMFWKRDVPVTMPDLLRAAQSETEERETPAWVRQLFEADRENLQRFQE